MKTKRLLQIKRKQIPQIIEIKVLHLQSRISYVVKTRSEQYC